MSLSCLMRTRMVRAVQARRPRGSSPDSLPPLPLVPCGSAREDGELARVLESQLTMGEVFPRLDLQEPRFGPEAYLISRNPCGGERGEGDSRRRERLQELCPDEGTDTYATVRTGSGQAGARRGSRATRRGRRRLSCVVAGSYARRVASRAKVSGSFNIKRCSYGGIRKIVGAPPRSWGGGRLPPTGKRATPGPHPCRGEGGGGTPHQLPASPAHAPATTGGEGGPLGR